MPDDPAERATVIAYLSLCEIRDLELGDEPEELRAARLLLWERVRPEEQGQEAPSPRVDLTWRAPFDNFEAAPRDVQDRIVLEAIGGHRKTSIQINDATARESPGCRSCGAATRKVLDRLVAVGELDREPCREGPCRWRWFRQTPGMVADLENAFAKEAV